MYRTYYHVQIQLRQFGGLIWSTIKGMGFPLDVLDGSKLAVNASGLVLDNDTDVNTIVRITSLTRANQMGVSWNRTMQLNPKMDCRYRVWGVIWDLNSDPIDGMGNDPVPRAVNPVVPMDPNIYAYPYLFTAGDTPDSYEIRSIKDANTERPDVIALRNDLPEDVAT